MVLTLEFVLRTQPSREDLIALTKLNPFDRFADGRPRVPDDLLRRMKLVTTEQAWGVLREHGYHAQFEGKWMETHPGKITVGRAVTAQFLPYRPDYHDGQFYFCGDGGAHTGGLHAGGDRGRPGPGQDGGPIAPGPSVSHDLRRVFPSDPAHSHRRSGGL